MCTIKKNVTVQAVKDQLKVITKLFGEVKDDEVKATLVMDEDYRSITAIYGGKVLMGLSLMVVSQIILMGKDLKEENDLTI